MIGFHFPLHIKVTSITMGDLRRNRRRVDEMGREGGRSETLLGGEVEQNLVRMFIGFVH
jgi:hypothetical protein